MRLSSVALLPLLAHVVVGADRHLRGGGSNRNRRLNEALMKRVIVTYEPGQGAACKQSMMGMASTLQTEYEFDYLNAVVVMATPDQVNMLENADYVVSIEEDVPRYPLSSIKTNWTMPSPKVSNSSSISMQADDLPYGLGLVQAPDLWQYGVKGDGVTVCVIDSGVDSSHEDLDDLSGYSGQSNLPWNDDSSGHGTHVAGTIAARDNGIGVVGVAPEASLYIVRVFGDGGGFLFSSGLVAAVNQCVSAGAKVINMSLGGPIGSNFENSAFASLLSQGVIPIAASGNDGNTQLSYPASYSGVMSVAAVDMNERLASFSQRNRMVDIAGPGVDVRSTFPSDRYGSISGTSMATPHISGVAALLFSFKPGASATEIQQAMIDSARDLGLSGRDDSYGYGLVQALEAAELLNGGALDGSGNDGTDEDSPTPPPPTNSSPTNPPQTNPSPTNPSPTNPSPSNPPPSPTSAPPGGSVCEPGRTLFQLDLTTDQFGSETSWVLRRNSDGATLSESNYGNEQTFVEQACLTNSECYTFTIFDSGRDGLCCSFGRGSYSVTYGDDVIQTGGSFSSAEEVSIGACGRDNPISGTCSQGLVPIDLFLRTDSFGFETSLQLVDQNGSPLEVASGLASNTDYGLTECVDPQGCYTLTIFDSFGDGLTGGTDGLFIVSFDGVEQDSATSFGSQISVEMGNACIS